MKKIYSFCVIFLLLFVYSTRQAAKAQLVVDQNISVATMMHDFFDSTCVSIDNVTYNGAPVAVGFFDGSATSLGINAGIMLTSGSISNAVGPNSWSGITQDNEMPGSPDLDALSGYSTFDAAIIEMDITPTLDTLYFKYVFGSDEYPEFVNFGFNDVFAFYVSGPGITGTQNIALVPGGTDPVSINTINCVYSNTQYYVCNDPQDFQCGSSFNCTNSLGNSTLEYDGFTTPITAQITVIPDSTYHVKLAIADASDFIYDSGIFIGVESLCGDGHLKVVPDYDFTVNGYTADFSNHSRYGTSYLWDFGDGMTSSDPNPVHTYSSDGVYGVTLTVNNYCSSISKTENVIIGLATAVNEAEDASLNIFPNPTNGIVNIKLESGQQGVVKIFDHSGKELKSLTIGSNTSVDLSAFPKGCFLHGSNSKRKSKPEKNRIELRTDHRRSFKIRSFADSSLRHCAFSKCLPEIVVSNFQAFSTIHFRLPAQKLFRLGNIRLALLRIIFRQRFEYNFLCCIGKLNYFVCELIDGDLIGVANVHRQVIITEEEAVNSFHQIVDITE
jgi:PKD repeat protein